MRKKMIDPSIKRICSVESVIVNVDMDEHRRIVMEKTQKDHEERGKRLLRKKRRYNARRTFPWALSISKDDNTVQRHPITFSKPQMQIQKHAHFSLGGYSNLRASLRCDTCSNVTPAGTTLLFRDEKCLSSRPTFKIYVNCPNCSAEIGIQRDLDGDAGYIDVTGAAQYFEPADDATGKALPQVSENAMDSAV